MSVCYTIPVEDAIKNNYDLSKVRKGRYRFVDLDQYLENSIFEVVEFEETQDGRGKAIFGSTTAQPYAALSYPWRDLSTIPGTDLDPLKNAFATAGLGDNEPRTSNRVLTKICTAAKQLGCKYLWMDKLCLRQDYDQEGIDDRAWQMKRMYSIYQNCKVCLVAAGGMVRLPRLIDRTSWINRAWTLQEALAPSEVVCLFDWNSGNRTIRAGPMASSVQQVLPGTGMAPLSFLLAANLAADIPIKATIIDVKGSKTEKLVPPDDTDSQVYLFGYGNEDNWPIIALQGALDSCSAESESELSARRLGIWRCITMRSARYAEDFVFATMGIFGVSVDPLVDARTSGIRKEGYPEDEIQELLDNFLGTLANGKGAKADWFAVAPELGPARETSALPLVPDINYIKDNDGRLATPVKTLLKYWDGFNWYLKDALKYAVDAPNGIQVSGRCHPISFAGVLPMHDSPRQKMVRCHDTTEFEVTEVTDKDRHALVIGSKARYTGGTFVPLAGDPDVELLMLVEHIPFTQARYRNIGYAWVGADFTKGWHVKSFGIGLRCG